MTRSYEKEEEEEAFRIWDCGSPLYDSYELVSLSHVIERHMMALPALEGAKQINTHHFYDDVQNLRSSSSGKNNDNNNHGGSSMANRFSGFLVNLVWKRKKKKEQHRKMASEGFLGFGIGRSREQKL